MPVGLQDRFTSLVPALTKYGATTVGVTLVVIGVAGLYETLTEGAEVADQAQPALAGKLLLGAVCLFLCPAPPGMREAEYPDPWQQSTVGVSVKLAPWDGLQLN